MKTSQRDNLKQIVSVWLSVFIGWMLVILVLVPVMSSMSASDAWISISVTGRRIMLFGGGALLIAGGFVLIKLATRRRKQQQTYPPMALLLLGLGSASMLAGGFLLLLVPGQI